MIQIVPYFRFLTWQQQAIASLISAAWQLHVQAVSALNQEGAAATLPATHLRLSDIYRMHRE